MSAGDAPRGLLARLGLSRKRAPQPPADGSHVFGVHLFRMASAPPPTGRYACWWPSEEAPAFSGSRTAASMRRSAAALEGIESYVLATWLRHLKLLPETAGRYALPEGAIYLDILDPSGVPLVLTASQEKGMRFHFPRGYPADGVEAVWTMFADYAEGWRGEAQRRGLAPDPETPIRPRQWWDRAYESLARQEETGARFACFGVVDHMVGFRKVPIDAFQLKEGKLVIAEFVTDEMMRLHKDAMLARLEEQAALASGRRTPMLAK